MRPLQRRENGKHQDALDIPNQKKIVSLSQETHMAHSLYAHATFVWASKAA